MIYNVELEGPDGKTYIAELEGPDDMTKHMANLEKSKSQEPDIFGGLKQGVGALKEGVSSLLSPKPEQMGIGDPMQRFAQTTLGSIYNQGRNQMMQQASPGISQAIGQGLTPSVMNAVVPGAGLASPLLSPKMQEAIGRQGVGVGVDVASGLLSIGAEKAINGISSAISKPFQSIKFGSSKTFRNMAEAIKTDMGKVDTAFTNDYTALMKQSGGKVVPDEIKNKIVQAATNSITKGTNEKYIEGISKQLSNPQLTVQDLHNMKPDIYAALKAERGGARSGIRDIYQAVNEAIADRKLAGKQYSDLTARFDSYKKEAEIYVKKLITDAEKNLTEVKLKNLKNLNQNQKNALLKLSNLAKSPNLSPEIQALIRGSNLRKVLESYGPRMAIGAGSLAAGGWAVGKLLRSND